MARTTESGVGAALVAVVLAALAWGAPAIAQTPFTMDDDGGWEKAEYTHRLADFPRIHPDGRVWFRFEAPTTAESVALRVDGISYPMEQDAQGDWNVVIPEMTPGFRIYSFVVDGTPYMDPGSQPFFMGGYASAVEYPDPYGGFHQPRHVPHGDVREHWFYSEVTRSFRRMYVYTPPGYEHDTDTRYPVLYLQHGGGEIESEWTHSGRANFILDNLIALGLAHPMIIVMNNGFVTRADGPDDGPRGYGPGFAAAFADMLIGEVIPHVDATYRTIPNARHRALAGLSMGGGQAFYIGLENLDTFRAVGVFGTGLFGGIGGLGAGEGAAFDAEAHIPGLLTRSESFNEALELFYVSVGEQDPRLDATRRAVSVLRQSGVEVEHASFPGGHEWFFWRRTLADFAQRLFR